MSDIEIARNATVKPISEIANNLDIPGHAIVLFGHDKAKIKLEWLEKLPKRDTAKLILVTAINPTPAGEGKTTTSVGLGDGLNRIGKKSIICLREPSLGPCFGIKGGAAGGGYSQVVPMEDINLHFTGDFHAITSAHNLLSAMIDNHIYWGNELNIDSRRIVWRRVIDINDRALRQNIVSLGSITNGFPRESGFDITVASEIMAILCLANDLADLQLRLGRIIIGYRRDKSAVYCRDIKADGAMTVLLKSAIQPNLVQTLESNPALIHGGPFANIAHGCNSVIATKAALKLADYVVTEAGFGADLGAEKFFDIKCRQAGISPSCVVLVATLRALKMNGNVSKNDLGKENLEAVRRGSCNLLRHLENLKKFGIPVIIAINHFVTDTAKEIQLLKEIVQQAGAKSVVCRHWAKGSEGTEELAKEIINICDREQKEFNYLYPNSMPLIEKIKKIATEIYRTVKVTANKKILNQLEEWEKNGYGDLPVCIAKTQYSFSADSTLFGAPEGQSLPIREVRLSAGAGFIVVFCGDIMTMPGLPRVPAAEMIGISDQGQVEGLF